MNKSGAGRLRIIAGRWRGRKLAFPDRQGLRPTPDRVRETLFNWLQHDIAGSQCLDLFAGSGALGFEAASRGAGSVLMVEKDVEAVAMLEANTAMLAAQQQIDILHRDAASFLEGKSRQYDIVFLDPPYRSALLAPCCKLLEDGQWLSNHARIYIECDARSDLMEMPENWCSLKSKKAGQVGYHLYSRTVA